MMYQVQELLQAYDPNSGTRMDMWIVWAFADGEGIYQMAYCSKPEYAEHIKRLLEAEGKQQADNIERPGSPLCRHGQYRSLCPECSGLA